MLHTIQMIFKWKHNWSEGNLVHRQFLNTSMESNCSAREKGNMWKKYISKNEFLGFNLKLRILNGVYQIDRLHAIVFNMLENAHKPCYERNMWLLWDKDEQNDSDRY